DRGHERMVAPAPHVAPRWRPRDRAGESDWLVEPDAFGNAVGNRALSHELGEVPPRVVQDRLWPCLADGSRDRRIEVGDDPLGRVLERREECLPAVHVLAALDLDETRLRA